MTPIQFYDTETSGLPLLSEPSESEEQPHIVQLGSILIHPETKELITFMDVIIKPDGWIIPKETAAIHGITTERAMDEGVPEKEAFEQFIEMWKQCDYRVGYNESFDARMLRIASFRFGDEALADRWKEAEARCAMKLAKPICKIPASAKARRFGQYKNPTLSEAYEFFTGKPLENAHSAMADTKACMEVYFAALDAEKVAA